MLMSLVYFALLITHLSLFSTPTCYISFDQEATQHCSYDKNLFHADQYKHSHNVYDATSNLLTYSASDFKNYFNYHHCTQEEILAHNQLYMSDEFVRLIKTFSGYQH